MICRLRPGRRWRGRAGIGEVEAFDSSVSTESLEPQCADMHWQWYPCAQKATTPQTCDYRHKNTEGCAGTPWSTNAGRVFLSQHLLSGLMYRSQGSIAALPAAINSLGLPDAQTVYWSLQTMTKSHPSERAEQLRRTESAKDTPFTPLSHDPTDGM